MHITETPLKGLLILEPRVFHDSRGYFFESFSKKQLEALGLPAEFVQDNQSLSSKGTLRGLHFQAPPHAQAKLVRVVQGRVLDVAVDLRKGSPTYGRYYSHQLSGENQLQMLIPEGFAHGFVALEDDTVFLYKCSRFYNKESEGGIFWADPDLGIDWGISDPVVSEKDQILPAFAGFTSPF